MFCPQCSAEIASDRVRFCTHCRFPVGSMKEFIVTEAAKIEAEEEKKFNPLRQRDITLGAGLMFLGAIKALLLTLLSTADLFGGGSGVYLFWLGLLFSAFLLFSQLSPRQRGLTTGASMVFLGSLLSIPISFLIGIWTFLPVPIVLLIPVLLMPIILCWIRLVRAFMRIFFDKEVLTEKKVYAPPQPPFNAPDTASPALPPAQSVAAVDLNTRQTLKAEMAERFSVTEDSTELLKNKQSFNPS